MNVTTGTAGKSSLVHAVAGEGQLYLICGQSRPGTSVVAHNGNEGVQCKRCLAKLAKMDAAGSLTVHATDAVVASESVTEATDEVETDRYLTDAEVDAEVAAVAASFTDNGRTLTSPMVAVRRVYRSNESVNGWTDITDVLFAVDADAAVQRYLTDPAIEYVYLDGVEQFLVTDADILSALRSDDSVTFMSAPVAITQQAMAAEWADNNPYADQSAEWAETVSQRNWNVARSILTALAARCARNGVYVDRPGLLDISTLVGLYEKNSSVVFTDFSQWLTVEEFATALGE